MVREIQEGKKIMKHIMNLDSSPFDKIKTGEKTIELRLYDEKRRCISVGDIIKFVNNDNINDILETKVIALYIFQDFETLYSRLPLLKCGYSDIDVNEAKASDMNIYYSLQKQKEYGVVGIELSLL